MLFHLPWKQNQTFFRLFICNIKNSQAMGDLKKGWFTRMAQERMVQTSESCSNHRTNSSLWAIVKILLPMQELEHVYTHVLYLQKLFEKKLKQNDN